MAQERAKLPRLLERISTTARRCRQAGHKGLISGRDPESAPQSGTSLPAFCLRHPDTMGKLVALTLLGACLALIGERLLNFR